MVTATRAIATSENTSNEVNHHIDQKKTKDAT